MRTCFQEHVGSTQLDALDLSCEPGPRRIDTQQLLLQLSLTPHVSRTPTCGHVRKRGVATRIGGTAVRPGMRPGYPGAGVPATAHARKYKFMVQKLGGWLQFATQRLRAIKKQVEKRGTPTKLRNGIIAHSHVDAATNTEQDDTELNEYGSRVPKGQGGTGLQKDLQGDVKKESQEEMSGVQAEKNGAGKQETEAQLTSIKPRVEYKVITDHEY